MSKLPPIVYGSMVDSMYLESEDYYFGIYYSKEWEPLVGVVVRKALPQESKAISELTSMDKYRGKIYYTVVNRTSFLEALKLEGNLYE